MLMAAQKIRNSGLCLLGLLFFSGASPAFAEWQVGQQAVETGSPSLAAYTRNEQGYGLSVYRNGDAIMAGFILPDRMFSLGQSFCPTYQIDRKAADNRSFDTAPCTVRNDTAEFVLGRISSNQVQSSLLLTVLNGNAVVFRFRLEDGSYRETTISLAGSKRAITEIIGHDIAILAPDTLNSAER